MSTREFGVNKGLSDIRPSMVFLALEPGLHHFRPALSHPSPMPRHSAIRCPPAARGQWIPSSLGVHRVAWWSPPHFLLIGVMLLVLEFSGFHYRCGSFGPYDVRRCPCGCLALHHHWQVIYSPRSVSTCVSPDRDRIRMRADCSQIRRRW